MPIKKIVKDIKGVSKTFFPACAGRMEGDGPQTLENSNWYCQLSDCCCVLVFYIQADFYVLGFYP